MASNGGFTRRANCATPTARSATDDDVRAALSSWLEHRDAPLVVRITPLAQPAIEASILGTWGLVVADETVVMTKTLNARPAGRPRAVDASGREFSKLLLALNDRPPEVIGPWTRMVERLGESATGIQDDESSAGFVAVTGGYAAIYSVAVAAMHSRQGRATDIMRSAESWAFDRGARTAFLQVRDDNEPAHVMYAGLGYEECYRYHYLQPEPAVV